MSASTASSSSTIRASARDRRLAEISVAVVVVMWSANFVIVKAAVEAIGPLTFTAARYAVAAVTLFLLVAWRFGLVRPPTRVVLTLMGLGVL